MVGPCKECKSEGELLEGICIDCIFKLADPKAQVSKEDLRRVREEVEKETAGLLPPNILRSLLSDLIDPGVDDGPRERLLEHASNEIQRLAGLGMCREMMRLADGFRTMADQVSLGLQETAQSIEEDVRRKVRILSALPRRPG